MHGGFPVAWRAFFFDGVPFYKGPIVFGSDDRLDMPEPPKDVIDAFATVMGVFGSCDLVLEEGGGWKCSRIMDGQFTGAPLGGDDEEYAQAFAKVVEESPHVSESWCLTARVKDENTVGEDHRVVHGTRHFAPGTKVWLHAPNWDERVGAIGVPRYSDKLTRIVMDVKKLEDFGVEMVRDKEILAALAHPYEPWPFSRLAPMEISVRSWDASDDCRERILDLIGRLTGLPRAKDSEGARGELEITREDPEETCGHKNAIPSIYEDRTVYAISILPGNPVTKLVLSAIGKVAGVNFLGAKPIAEQGRKRVFEALALKLRDKKALLDDAGVAYRIEPEFPH